eukprot:2386986-Pyramimonas_sp.AAC.1
MSRVPDPTRLSEDYRDRKDDAKRLHNTVHASSSLSSSMTFCYCLCCVVCACELTDESAGDGGHGDARVMRATCSVTVGLCADVACFTTLRVLLCYLSMRMT